MATVDASERDGWRGTAGAAARASVVAFVIAGGVVGEAACGARPRLHDQAENPCQAAIGVEAVRVVSRAPLIVDHESWSGAMIECERYQLGDGGQCRAITRRTCDNPRCLAIVHVARREGSGRVTGTVTADGETITDDAVHVDDAQVKLDEHGRFAAAVSPGRVHIDAPSLFYDALVADIAVAADEEVALDVRFDHCSCCDASQGVNVSPWIGQVTVEHDPLAARHSLGAGAVTGFVVDARTRAPVANVTIVVTGAGARTDGSPERFRSP